MLHVCPEDKCQYKTTKAERMEAHKKKTGHGRITKKREFRGHLTAKGKSANAKGGKK